jgi:hypothetical protein
LVPNEKSINEDKDEIFDDEAPIEEEDFMKKARQRSRYIPFYRFFYLIVAHWVFNFIITIVIILNAISLAADDFPQSI